MLYAHLEICTVGFLLSKWSPCRVPAFFFFLPSKRKENVIKQIPSWGAEPRFLIYRQLSFFSIFFFPSVRGQKEKKKRKRKKQNKTRKPHPRVIWARNWMAQYLLTWRPQTPLICQSSPECAPTPTPHPPSACAPAPPPLTATACRSATAQTIQSYTTTDTVTTTWITTRVSVGKLGGLFGKASLVTRRSQVIRSARGGSALWGRRGGNKRK